MVLSQSEQEKKTFICQCHGLGKKKVVQFLFTIIMEYILKQILNPWVGHLLSYHSDF